MKELVDTTWSLEKVPLKWKRGLIIKIPKKGNLMEWKNWRGVPLLPVVSKILGRIIVDRIRMGFTTGSVRSRLDLDLVEGRRSKFSSYAIYYSNDKIIYEMDHI